MVYAPKYKVRLFTPPFWIFPKSKNEMLHLEAHKSALKATNDTQAQLPNIPDIDTMRTNAEDLKVIIHRLAQWLHTMRTKYHTPQNNSTKCLR
ncbi:Aste57867_12100 [Aphanomyces stellatus]|uniref:Aste57867_12100 protein n=1 Tax=Aphanomyces stellatus TaxID=120398 RepID=A0A485KUM9_9STRA|nr:hypothetical protein As57867_012055 [Aphanomyces stellatus]VFT88955.1 Aste57867_12100 [Aphanomyces stellatus]